MYSIFQTELNEIEPFGYENVFQLIHDRIEATQNYITAQIEIKDRYFD